VRRSHATNEELDELELLLVLEDELDELLELVESTIVKSFDSDGKAKV